MYGALPNDVCSFQSSTYTFWFWFWRYLMRGLIWHLSQSSIRPSIYFSSFVKSRSNPFLEPTSLEIKQQYLKQLLLCYCYRPPSCNVSWLSDFSDSMEKCFLEQNECIVLGDFNFDILNYLVALEYGLNSWNPSTILSWLTNQHEFHNTLQPLLTISFSCS